MPLVLVIVACLFNATEPQTTRPADPVAYVAPVNWQRFDAGAALGSDTRTTARLLNSSLRYNLAWVERTFQRSPDGGGYVIETMDEPGVRPAASVALAVAIALKTGLYDETMTGLPATEAHARLVRLIRGLVGAHRVNGAKKSWGDGWQTAVWATLAGNAGWLIWDDLGTSDRRMTVRMVEFEADRFLRAGYQVPYWNSRGGDTKAEENAWNATVHQLAVAMMPQHPNALRWKRIASELMVSAFASRTDRETNVTVIDGRPVREWLKGYNLRDDGALVNHNIIHDDYMTCITLNLRSYLTQSLAGQAVPQSARFNADRVYRALVAHEWPSPPYEPPGGTMYTPGRAEVYYPQGTDWSRYRFDIFFATDTWAHLLAMDRTLPHRAAEWLPVRSQRLLRMQSRHPDGRLFAENEFTTYRGAEQMTAWVFADTLLVNWLHDHRALSREADWNEH